MYDCVLRVVIAAALLARTAIVPASATAAARTTDPARRIITLDDIVNTRRFKDVAISRDGGWVAYTVTWTDVVADKLKTGLYVIATSPDSQPTRIEAGDAMNSLSWDPDGRAFTYAVPAGEGADLWSVSVPQGKPRKLLHVAGAQFVWSADHKDIAFLARAASDKKETSPRKGGVVMPSQVGGLDLVDKVWDQTSYDLRVVHVETQQEDVVRHFDPGTTPQITSWSPDGQRLTVFVTHHLQADQKEWPTPAELELIALDGSRPPQVMPRRGAVLSSRWSPDGRLLAIIGTEAGPEREIRSPALLSVRTSAGDTRPFESPTDVDSIREVVGWTPDSKRVYVEVVKHQRSVRGLYAVDVATGQWEWQHDRDRHISKCALATDSQRAVCTVEAATVPPTLTLIDLRSRAARELVDINPEYSRIRLSEATELRITNRYGLVSSTFVLKPLNYQQGRRYPVVSILYRFTGDFHLDVFGNYPIQAFAANGFVVLLVSVANPPYRGGDAAGGMRSEAYGPLATIEASVDAAVSQGIADPSRVGLMGWSYGSFLTDFAITHSKRFAVASSGDGGTFSAPSYWLANSSVRAYFDAVLGGPPEGATLRHWQDVVPELSVDRVDIPVLLEYTDRNFIGASFYGALQRQQVPVEMVVYPGAGHVFDDGRPSDRRASLERNLDWFNFWLQSEEDPAASKREQYERWRRLRDRHRESGRGTP